MYYNIIFAFSRYSVLQVYGVAAVQLVAQVFGYQAVALDDGQSEEEPTAVGRAPGTRELRRAAPTAAAAHGGRGRHGAGTGSGTGLAAAAAAEPPGLASGRHVGDGGQDGAPALGASESGQGDRPRSTVHDTAAGEPAGCGAFDAAGAGGKPSTVHVGPDPVPGGGRRGWPKHVSGLVQEQWAAAVVGWVRRRQSHG